jgi:hypothetical protein
MTTARDILIEATRREIRLTPKGTKMLLESVAEVDPDFEIVLLQHKSELMRLLKGKRHLAMQIIAGDFDGCDREVFRTVLEDLSANPFDPLCRQAIDRLKVNVRPTNHR